MFFFQITCRLPKLILTFKLVWARYQTHLPCEFVANQFGSSRDIRRKPRFLVSGDLDLWHSNSSEQGAKHVFPVNLAQIRSAVPEIFHTQTKSHSQKENLMQFTACGNNYMLLSNHHWIMSRQKCWYDDRSLTVDKKTINAQQSRQQLLVLLHTWNWPCDATVQLSAYPKISKLSRVLRPWAFKTLTALIG